MSLSHVKQGDPDPHLAELLARNFTMSMALLSLRVIADMHEDPDEFVDAFMREWSKRNRKAFMESSSQMVKQAKMDPTHILFQQVHQLGFPDEEDFRVCVLNTVRQFEEAVREALEQEEEGG